MQKKIPIDRKIMYKVTSVIQLVTLTLQWVIFKFFLRLQVRGSEKIKNLNKESLLFASNHVSHLDPLLIPVGLFGSRHFPTFMVSLSKDAYRDSWFERAFYGGSIFKLMGAYPTFRGLGNYEKSLRHQIEILEHGRSLCIFPEGVATSDATIRPPKPGVAFLSHRTGSRVVPVAIHGLEGINWKTFFLRKHNVTVIFGRPLSLYNNPLSSEEANARLSDDRLNSYRKNSQQIMSYVGTLKQQQEEISRDASRQEVSAREGTPAVLR